VKFIVFDGQILRSAVPLLQTHRQGPMQSEQNMDSGSRDVHTCWRGGYERPKTTRIRTMRRIAIAIAVVEAVRYKQL